MSVAYRCGTRPGGVIGRRRRLKPAGPSGREGSSPSPGTEALRDELYQGNDRADAALGEVDLAGVTFMDSAGYRAVVDANDYAVRTDHLLVIRNLSELCTKLVQGGLAAHVALR